MAIVGGRVVAFEGEPQSSADSRFAGSLQRPILWARLCDEGCTRKIVFLLAHPSANFMEHDLLDVLQRRGVACMGANTRYMGNDTELTMERCIQDIGRAVRFLRSEGYERIVLVGHSGGGALSAFYQAEAEHLSLSTLPDGSPIDLDPSQLPPVDALALLAPHPSRAAVLRDWLDPSVIDESDRWSCDPKLDMFKAEGPPYSADWLERYRAAQAARSQRLTASALASIRMLDERQGDESFPSDQLLVVYRTGAEPRSVDTMIDRNQRSAMSLALARRTNYSPVSMARLSTVRSWLSQWSVEYSRANGPDCLKRTSVPAILVHFGADHLVYPSQTGSYLVARKNEVTEYRLDGANHFLKNQPKQQEELAAVLIDWAKAQLG